MTKKSRDRRKARRAQTWFEGWAKEYDKSNPTTLDMSPWQNINSYTPEIIEEKWYIRDDKSGALLEIPRSTGL